MSAPKGNKYAVGNNGGQPTKYNPEYCEAVIELGKEGKSLAQMCSHFDISRATIDNWANEHEVFFEALMCAMAHMQAKLEEMGFTGLTSKDFNASAWKTTMQARFRDDYTERKEVKHGGEVSVRSVTRHAIGSESD